MEHVRGMAATGTGAHTWAAIIKRTSGPGLTAARRELAAYRQGIAAQRSADSLCAPSLFASDQSKDHVELWLELLVDEHGGQWPLHRFGTAARHIAHWDAYVGQGPIAGFDSADDWAQQHGQPNRVAEAMVTLEDLRAAPASEEVMERLQDDGFARTEAMIRSTRRRISQLARLPQTLLHHDLVRANLFALSGGRTAAIDWENVGHGPFGVDLAPLVAGSVRRGEASAADLPELENTVCEAP